MAFITSSPRDIFSSFYYIHSGLPQIYRNVMRGVRKALGWRYVFGMTVSRGAMALWLIWCQKGDWVFLWESEDADIIWGWILTWMVMVSSFYSFSSGNLWSEIFHLGKRISFPCLMVVNMCFSYFLRRIIILHRMWMMRNRTCWMGNVMIVQFVCNRLSFHYLPASGGGGSDTVALSANVLGRKVARTPCGHVFHTTCLEQVTTVLKSRWLTN